MSNDFPHNSYLSRCNRFISGLFVISSELLVARISRVEILAPDEVAIARKSAIFFWRSDKSGESVCSQRLYFGYRSGFKLRMWACF
ncbi:hypothetical protein SH449x_003272 [Pirellulaceae bacterium SH449]